MLGRIGIRVVTASILILLVVVSPASADPVETPTTPPKTAEKPRLVKVCTAGKCQFIPITELYDGGKPAQPGTGGDGKGKGQVKRVCEFHGAAQACTSKLGDWSNSEQCYLHRAAPQPPFTDPAWKGHTDGSIWACVREQGYNLGKHLVTEWVWIPGKPDTVAVDPVTLAYRAIAEMQLAPPRIKTAPGVGQVGLVNMPVWLWVTKSENTWGPIVRSASVPGLSVTATAKVKAINWSMGDGSTVRCEGPGTPYSKAMGVKSSPTCGHRYSKTSHKLPNCKYPVTAVAQWDITWTSTLGDNGQISMTQQAATQLRIGEAVPVLVDPNGGDATEPAVAGC